MLLITLQLKTSSSFEKNFKRLENKILRSQKNSLILAPELYLTGYSYERLNEASKFTKKVLSKLKKFIKK